MEIFTKKPTDTINKAYRKKKINKSDFERFRSEITILVSKIDENESEEHSKYFSRDFLKHTFYTDNKVNTKDRTDLAIYPGSTNKSPVNVIFETKKHGSRYFPDIKNTDSFNCKALHESILYYLKEHSTGNNEIKHIVHTNLFEWYIFDSHEFERCFCNTYLKKKYEKWESGQKSGKHTNLFYNEIAKPFIQTNSFGTITSEFRPPVDKLKRKGNDTEKYLTGTGLKETYRIQWSGNTLKYDTTRIEETKPLDIFKQEKFLSRDIGLKFNAVYDNSGFLCLKTIYFFYLSEEFNSKFSLKFITSVLNSLLINRYFKLKFSVADISVGYLRFRKQFVELIRVPDISPEQQKPVIEKVDAIIEKNAQIIMLTLQSMKIN